MSTYLTRMPHIGGRTTNPHELHRWLDQVFNCGDSDEGRPYLFAIAEQENALYVRSRVPGRWGGSDCDSRIEPYVPALGAVHRIEVILNPMTRHGHIETFLRFRSEVIGFAVSLLKRNGFAVATQLNEQFKEVQQIQVESLRGMAVNSPNKPKPIPLYLWRCSAQVIVTDADKTKNAIEKGIGRSKRYGAGLILIRE